MTGCTAPMYIPQDTLEHAKSMDAPVYLRAGISPLPDNAGGRQVGFTLRNIGKEPIKYLTVYTTLINQVNDEINCRIGYSGSVRFTGPIEVDETIRGDSQSKCYDVPQSKLLIERIHITFMDDRDLWLDREALKQMKAIHPDS